MLTACPYPQLFEPQSVPRPADGPGAGVPALASYAIETLFADNDSLYRPGEHYTFDMVLMTPMAISQLALIIAAWKRAFINGVGKANGKANLMQVEHLSVQEPASIVYSEDNPQVRQHMTELPVPRFLQPGDVPLHLQTPLRIEKKGRLIKERQMTASLFLRHLIRRVSFQLISQQAGAFSLVDIRQLNTLADQVQDGKRQLTWCDWQRYSSRQKQKMTLGGLVGHWQLLQVPPQLLSFIYLGQWLHVGKESTFGLGKYQWQTSSLSL